MSTSKNIIINALTFYALIKKQQTGSMQDIADKLGIGKRMAYKYRGALEEVYREEFKYDPNIDSYVIKHRNY